MFIGTKIKEVRILKNLSRQDMAAKLGISVTAYAKIERDDTDPNFSRLQQIAEVFDMSVLELIGYKEKNIFLIQGDNQNSPLGQNIVTYNQQTLVHENEVLRLENNHLKQQNDNLLEIIRLMKEKAD